MTRANAPATTALQAGHERRVRLMPVEHPARFPPHEMQLREEPFEEMVHEFGGGVDVSLHVPREQFDHLG